MKNYESFSKRVNSEPEIYHQNSGKKHKFNEVGLYYKRQIEVNENYCKISSSIDAYENLKNIYNELTIDHKEFFYVLAVNNSNEIVNVMKASEGSIVGTLVDVRLVLQFLLLNNAVGFIVSHNHPSGKLKPSNLDEKLTQKLKRAGGTLDIKLLDHIIVTSKGYLSFADENIL